MNRYDIALGKVPSGKYRVPFIPSNANFKTSVIQDPVSGLAFMFSEITGDGMITYRLNIVYGIKVLQSDFIAAILG
jgi:hypothetical protein